jgi:hypothetical protein
MYAVWQLRLAEDELLDVMALDWPARDRPVEKRAALAAARES